MTLNRGETGGNVSASPLPALGGAAVGKNGNENTGDVASNQIEAATNKNESADWTHDREYWNQHHASGLATSLV